MKFIAFLLFFSIAMAAKADCYVDLLRAGNLIGAAADPAQTTAVFVNLVRRLTTEKAGLSSQDIEALAGLKSPANPVDYCSGSLTGEDSFAYSSAFETLLSRDDLDWRDITDKLAAFVSDKKAQEVHRDEIKKETKSLFYPFIRKILPERFYQTDIPSTVTVVDGVPYALMELKEETAVLNLATMKAGFKKANGWASDMRGPLVFDYDGVTYVGSTRDLLNRFELKTGRSVNRTLFPEGNVDWNHTIRSREFSKRETRIIKMAGRSYIAGMDERDGHYGQLRIRSLDSSAPLEVNFSGDKPRERFVDQPQSLDYGGRSFVLQKYEILGSNYSTTEETLLRIYEPLVNKEKPVNVISLGKTWDHDGPATLFAGKDGPKALIPTRHDGIQIYDLLTKRKPKTVNPEDFYFDNAKEVALFQSGETTYGVMGGNTWGKTIGKKFDEVILTFDLTNEKLAGVILTPERQTSPALIEFEGLQYVVWGTNDGAIGIANPVDSVVLAQRNFGIKDVTKKEVASIQYVYPFVLHKRLYAFVQPRMRTPFIVQLFGPPPKKLSH